ncbi:MAG: hypothetical protein ACFB11_02600 [Paracoccaceae bacterium]
MQHIRIIVGVVVVISLISLIVLFNNFGFNPADGTVSAVGTDFVKEIFKTILSVCLVGGIYFIYQNFVDEGKSAKETADKEKQKAEEKLEKERRENRENEKIRSELRQKNRQLDSQLRREFINNNGQFRSNVRTWKIYKPTPKKFHELLPATIQEEGKLEALILEAASRRPLTDKQACLFGLYRQGYQTLRQHLDDDKKKEPPHNYNNDDYHLFAMLFAALADLLTEERELGESVNIERNVDLIYECRSDNWDQAIQNFGRSHEISDVLERCAEDNRKDRM